MHPSLRLCSAARVHKPLIHFVGKRQWPSSPAPAAPHAHPFAPPETKQAFPEFVKKFQSSAASGGAPTSQSSPKEDVQVYRDFWEAPARLWDRDIDEAEIEAITSGGASLH
ncbi:hypothetical protein B0H21DRAFT_724948 [Amylocystis lapponica]|nr:hypothetical protein B0H21DRAFT_724948 [Amylocystis lapponica]